MTTTCFARRGPGPEFGGGSDRARQATPGSAREAAVGGCSKNPMGHDGPKAAAAAEGSKKGNTSFVKWLRRLPFLKPLAKTLSSNADEETEASSTSCHRENEVCECVCMCVCVCSPLCVVQFRHLPRPPQSCSSAMDHSSPGRSGRKGGAAQRETGLSFDSSVSQGAIFHAPQPARASASRPVAHPRHPNMRQLDDGYTHQQSVSHQVGVGGGATGRLADARAGWG